MGNEPTSGKRLDRVEITGRNTDSELRRRSPVAKQIYGRDELDKYGDTSVADVLKRLPGVNVSDGAPRMRGLGSGYTLILINGDPAPPASSWTSWIPRRSSASSSPRARAPTRAPRPSPVRSTSS
ncbi:TonB-dependent receptor plug domain-containing protein [Roseateles chitinivorans]|uniref:TonB-dependent receptor plug domain-containing protein n=1 Tax=Roseateles chitinivorans TaxID=2917965 RepID=UPI003D66B684